jgi:uncharacterized membrane protein (Fun14 family)
VSWGVPKIGTVAEVASGALTLAEPAGTAQGDLQIACIAIRSTVGFTNADWTKIEGQLSGDTDATNGIASGEMWYRVRGASAGTLQFSRTGGDLGRGVIIGYTGGKQNAAAVLGNHSSATLGAASATVTTATISTTEANELIVAMTSAGDNLSASAFDAATDPTTASGATDTTNAPTAGTWRERTDTGTNTGADGGLAVADAVRATAGATGTIQATISASARHVMIASAFRMLVDTAVAAGVGALIATGFAPTVTTTSHSTVAPGVGAVVVTGFAPTVTSSDHQTVAPGVGVLTVIGQAPTVVADTHVAAGVAAIAVTGFAPSVDASAGEGVTPGVGAATFAGFAPTVAASNHQSVAPSLGILAVIGFAPTVTAVADQVVAPGLAALTLSGFAPSVEVSGGATEVTPDVGVGVLTGFAPVVTTSAHQTVSVDVGTITLAGYAPIVTVSEPSIEFLVTDASASSSTSISSAGPAVTVSDVSGPSLSLSAVMSLLDCAVDFDAEVYITRKNTSTRETEAATGLTGVTLRLAATPGGAAIHASLSGTSVEAGTTGRYVYTFDVADLQAQLLPTYLNAMVYLVVEKSGVISTKSFPLPVARSV